MLIAINVIAFVAETATGAPLGGGGGGSVWNHGTLAGPYITELHQYYRLLSSGFLHDGLLHILFNMVFLYFMGIVLEPAIGSVNFAFVYVASLFAGSFGALLFQPDVQLVGASGACFGVLGALVVVARYRGISIWQSGLGVTLLINVVFSLTYSGISIGAHVGGFVGGLIAGWAVLELGERRGMAAAARAACVLVGVVGIVLAIAVAGGHGLTPNGLTI